MKRVTFIIDESLFKEAKIKTINNDLNMTEYIIGLIRKDLSISESGVENAEIKN